MPKRKDAVKQVEAFNQTHPKGTEVYVRGHAGLTRIVSEAFLYSGRPVVYTEAFSGAIELSLIRPKKGGVDAEA